jgi:nucleolar pre-ribosomal-associated protein 1
LAQHCAALALAKCLTKYEEILHAFSDVAESLEESDERQWRRIKDIEGEVRRKVPDFQVIAAFSQQKPGDLSMLQPGVILPVNPQYNTQRIALLSESVLRLLWLYHARLPSLVAEVQFDVGKLLSSSFGTPKTYLANGKQGEDPGGLHRLRQPHVLRLLKE